MPQRVSGFTEGVVKQSQGHVYVTFIKDHRGLDLDHIVKRAVRAQEDASIPHLVDDPACLGVSRFQAFPVPDEFNPQEQASASYISNEFVAFLEFLEPLQESKPQDTCTILEAFIVDHIEHRNPTGAGDGVAAERGKELHAIVEGFGDGPRRHHGAHGVPIADGLAKYHDVRSDVVQFKSPEDFTKATEADLDLVGDADAAGIAHMTERGREVAMWKGNLPATGQHRLCEEPGNGSPTGACLADDVGNLDGVCRAGIGITIWATIGIRHRQDMDPFGGTDSASAVELVWAHGDAVASVSVVGAVQDKNIFGACCSASESKCKFVGFSPGVDHEACVQFIRHRLAESFCVVCQVLMEIPGVGIQFSRLSGDGIGHTRMAMADVADIVDQVEERPAVGSKEVLPPARDDVQGLFVVQ